MSQKIALYSFLVSSAVLSACASKPPAKPLHAEVLNLIQHVESVAILQPQVRVKQSALSSDNARLPEEEQRIADVLAKKLEELVAIKNYAIRKDVTDQPNAQMQATELEVQKLRTAVVAALKQPTKPESEETKPRYSVGLAARALADRAHADALLLTGYSGFKKSSGRQTTEVVTTFLLSSQGFFGHTPAPEGGALSVALIDGATGEVLWIARTEFDPTVQESASSARTLEGAVDKVFATLQARERAVSDSLQGTVQANSPKEQGAPKPSSK